MQSSSQQQIIYSSQLNNIEAIAKCHQACFPGSLSGRLGIRYIKRTFEWFLVANNRFLFHIELNGEVIGYCGGFVPKRIGDGSSSGMLQHAFKEAVIGIIKKPWLAFHTEVRAVYPFIFKNIKKRVLPQKNNIIIPATNSVNNVTQYSGLVVIGVHPQHRGTGVFNNLMEHFFKESKRLGVIGCRLSVRKDNARGIGAYNKFDWQIEQETEKTFVLKKTF